MNNTKANLWLFNKRTKDITFSYEVKQKGRFIKASLFAVILGLILGGIVIGVQNVNPFEYLKELFVIGFGNLYIDSTIQWLCIYIIAALAVGIGFKSGMFNIGVSGQMLMGAGISIIFYKLVVEPTGAFNAGYIIVMFLICVLSGAIMAGIAGLLKALFNIHEVVTTIMLNWATWYLMKYLFTAFADTIGGKGISSSGLIPGNSLTINGSTIAFPIIFAILAVVVISILLSKTTFGFKLKSVGASPDASKYAGYNVKTKLVDAMLISGALAGVASFVNIFTITPNMTFSVDTLPSIGYDAVAITLVAFNNPIGTVFSSFLWATLQSGGASTAALFNLPTQMSQLIFGIIVYFAAISVVFINWFPILKLRIMIAMSGSKTDQIKVKNLHKQQLKYRQQLIDINKSKGVTSYKEMVEQQINDQKELLKVAKSEKQKQAIKQTIKNYKQEMNLFVKEYRKNLKEQIRKCSEEIKRIKNNNYVSKINSAKEGINRRKFNAVREVEQDALSKTSLIRSNLLSVKDGYAQDFKARKNWLRNKLRALKKEYKLRQNQNLVWLESETGEKNHYWEMRNGRIESKAVINKIKIDCHNEILTIKSDCQMAKLDLASKLKNKPQVLKKKEAALNKKMDADILKVKNKQKDLIRKEHEKVQKLTTVYKETKKANEELAKQIVAKKKSFNSKLYKQSPITKESVSNSGELLKELYFENQKDLKAVEKINEKHDTEGASLVDIRLAYNQRRDRTKAWYEEECARAINKHEAFVKQYNDEQAEAMYQQAKQAVEEYEKEAKKLGADVSTEIVNSKRKLLKDLINKIKKIWPEEYSNTDHPRWSKKRLEIYNRINKDQAKLSKIVVVNEADKKIKNINSKYKWINEMYNENIKKFRDQYLANKKADIVLAQKQYHDQVEAFIADLEKYDFVRNDQLKEVK